MTSEPPITQPDQTEEPKQNYTTPKLVQYGNIREITGNMGGTVGMNDGGGGNDKTG